MTDKVEPVKSWVSGLDGAQDALNRMKRAHDRKTGCYLTREMVYSLSLTSIAQTWAEADPRSVITLEGE